MIGKKIPSAFRRFLAMWSTAQAVKDFAKKFSMTPLEKKLSEILSNENWGTPNSTLIEMSQTANGFSDYLVITRELWLAMEDSQDRWRRVYKSLVLLEFLLKYGPERIAEDARGRQQRIRQLMDWKYHEEGKERCAGIREKSGTLLNLLNDAAMLKGEKVKASNVNCTGLESSGAVRSFSYAATSVNHGNSSITSPIVTPLQFKEQEKLSTGRLDSLRSKTVKEAPVVDLLDFGNHRDPAKNSGLDLGNDFGDFVKASSPKAGGTANRSDPADVFAALFNNSQPVVSPKTSSGPTSSIPASNPFDFFGPQGTTAARPPLQSKVSTNPFDFSGL